MNVASLNKTPDIFLKYHSSGDFKFKVFIVINLKNRHIDIGTAVPIEVGITKAFIISEANCAIHGSSNRQQSAGTILMNSFDGL
jgi:hypothetical protein